MPLSRRLQRRRPQRSSPRKLACPICGGQCGREFEFDSKVMEILFIRLCRHYKSREEATLVQTMSPTTSDITALLLQQQGYPEAHQSLDLLEKCPQPLSDDQLAEAQLHQEWLEWERSLNDEETSSYSDEQSDRSADLPGERGYDENGIWDRQSSTDGTDGSEPGSRKLTNVDMEAIAATCACKPGWTCQVHGVVDLSALRM